MGKKEREGGKTVHKLNKSCNHIHVCVLFTSDPCVRGGWVGEDKTKSNLGG